MTIVRIFVGLDYHDSCVQVCVMDSAGKVLANRRVDNDWRAIERVAGKFGGRVRAAIEACSGAAALAEELTHEAGWSVDLAHAGYVARLKQNPDKTDFGDSQLLADLIRVGYLPKVWLAPEHIRELRRMVRFRQQWADQRRNTKLRIRALLRDLRIKPPKVRAWTVAWKGWLAEGKELPEASRWIIREHLTDLEHAERRIRIVEKYLAEMTADDRIVDELLQMPGIGFVTAVTLRAEIGQFDRFRSGKQLARFCGLSPRNASSGQRQADAGLVKAGNPRLRAVLIQAAHRLANRDQRWGRLAFQMRKRGKPGSVVAAAIANRWMRWLYHQMQPEKLAA